MAPLTVQKKEMEKVVAELVEVAVMVKMEEVVVQTVRAMRPSLWLRGPSSTSDENDPSSAGLQI